MLSKDGAALPAAPTPRSCPVTHASDNASAAQATTSSRRTFTGGNLAQQHQRNPWRSDPRTVKYRRRRIGKNAETSPK